MTYDESQNLIEEALTDIARAENLTGEARPEETAALMAAIAQAKLLAVIASVIGEVQDRAVIRTFSTNSRYE